MNVMTKAAVLGGWNIRSTHPLMLIKEVDGAMTDTIGLSISELYPLIDPLLQSIVSADGGVTRRADADIVTLALASPLLNIKTMIGTEAKGIVIYRYDASWETLDRAFRYFRLTYDPRVSDIITSALSDTAGTHTGALWLQDEDGVYRQTASGNPNLKGAKWDAVNSRWIAPTVYPTRGVRTVKGIRYPTTDVNFRGLTACPATTQAFQHTDAIATHTTASIPVGTWTLWIEGTGTVTASAGTAVGSGFGAASEGSPKTITITTAGTVVLTVADTVTFGQLENLPFKSPRIPNTTAASLTRPAVYATYSTTGLLPMTDATHAQNFAIAMRVVPLGAGQSGKYIFSSVLDSNNSTSIGINSDLLYIRKRIGGVSTFFNSDNYSHTTAPFWIVVVFTDLGLSVKVKQDGGAWTAWADNTTANGKVPAPIASTYQIGAISNASGTSAHYPIGPQFINLGSQATLAGYKTVAEAKLAEILI